MARTKARSCTGKVAYRTKAEARQVYFAMLRKGASRLHWYKCKFCTDYHLGHKPKPRRKR